VKIPFIPWMNILNAKLNFDILMACTGMSLHLP